MKTYCVVSYPATADQYEQSIEEESTARVSLDEQDCILKWRGATPPAFAGFPIMTHAEALTLMQSPAWQDETDTQVSVDTSTLTKKELRELAKSLGVTGTYIMTKAMLIAAIEEQR